MTLVRLGGGIADVRGGMGGVYFHRDKAGLHMARKPRNIYRRTSAQDLQRKAFSTARAFSHDNRIVSYNIYRALNGLSMQLPPFDYQIPHLQAPP